MTLPPVSGKSERYLRRQQEADQIEVKFSVPHVCGDRFQWTKGPLFDNDK